MEYTQLDKIRDKILVLERLREIEEIQAERARSVNIEVCEEEMGADSPSTMVRPKPPLQPKLSKRASLRRRLLIRNMSQTKPKSSKKDKSYVPASPNVSYSGAYIAQRQDAEVVDQSTPITRTLVLVSGEQQNEYIYLPTSMEHQTQKSPESLQDVSVMPSISQSVDRQSRMTPRAKVGQRPEHAGLSPTDGYLTEGTPRAGAFRSPVYTQAEIWSPDFLSRMEDPTLEEKVSPIYSTEGSVKSRFTITPDAEPPFTTEPEPNEVNVDGDVLSYAMDYNENMFSHPSQEMLIRPCPADTRGSMFYSMSDYGSDMASGGNSTYMRSDPRYTLTYDLTSDTVRRFAVGPSESTTSSAMSHQESPPEQFYPQTMARPTEKSQPRTKSTDHDSQSITTISPEVEQQTVDKTLETLRAPSSKKKERRPTPIPRFPRTTYSPEEPSPWSLTPTTTLRFPPPHKLSRHVHPYPNERHIQIALFKHDDGKVGIPREISSSGISDDKAYSAIDIDTIPDIDVNDLSESQLDNGLAQNGYMEEPALESHIPGLNLPGYLVQGQSASKWKGRKGRVSSPLSQIRPGLSRSAPNLSSPAGEGFAGEGFAMVRRRHTSARVECLDGYFSHDGSGNVTLSLPDGLPHRETLV